MISLLSKIPSNQPLETHRKIESAFATSSFLLKEVDAAYYGSEFGNVWQRNHVEGKGLLERMNRAAQKVVEAKNDRHHRQNQDKQQNLFRRHCRSPKPLSAPVDR
jgi:hypothetical protein